MTTTPRFERDLPSLLEDLYLAGTPDYRDDLVQRVATKRQRPAWTFPERWLPMDVATQAVPTARMPWRQVGVLALIALLLAVAVIGIAGSQRRLPEPFGVAENGQLVYVAGGDVLARDDLGSAPRTIVGGPEVEIAAWFSPRGDRLLVIRAVAGGEELWVGAPDGSDLVRVGDGPFQQPNWVEFSPDGSLLAVEHTKAGIPRIELLATDGSSTRRVTEMTATSPTFRPPDGRELLFRGQEADGGWGFYLIDVEGGEPRRLAIDGEGLEGGSYDLQSPAWSPSGDRLAFHSLLQLPESQGGTNGFRIHLASIDAAGRVMGAERLEVDPTADDESNPSFTQDGRALVYLQRFGLLGETDHTDSAWIMPLDGTQARPLGVETSNGDGFWVTVAPDDQTFVVHLYREEEDWQVDRATNVAIKTDVGSSSGVNWRREAP